MTFDELRAVCERADAAIATVDRLRGSPKYERGTIYDRNTVFELARLNAALAPLRAELRINEQRDVELSS